MALVGLIIAISGVYFAIWVGTTPLITFYFGHKQVGQNIITYWLGFALSLTFLIFGLVLLIHSIRDILHKPRTYECTEGFMELEDDDKIIAAMRWDQILTLWHRVIVVAGLHAGIGISDTYIVVGKDEEKHEISYIQLRKRIEREVIRHFLPIVIEKYHAGELISFGSIIVSKSGVSLRGDWFSWHEISPTFLNNGENIIFFSKSNPQSISLPISQIPNICVLEAFFTYIANQQHAF
jgi:hypothetical protein